MTTTVPTKKQTLRTVVPVGLAIFAMFFGAGNLIYPLTVGVHAGNHIGFAMIGFLISGIIVPLLGLFAISLYHGDYMAFFRHIGRTPGFVVATLLVILLGIFVATPRCGLISLGTLTPLFPKLGQYPYLFNLVFFSLVYFVSIKQHRVVDALGKILSPMKLSILFILIVLGIGTAHRLFQPLSPAPSATVFLHALQAGYGTMDLLAAFFFCAFVHRTICRKLQNRAADEREHEERRLTLLSCLIGACLLAIIYGFFIVVANLHAAPLQNVPTQKLIGALSLLILHRLGGIFLAGCVTLAVFSTAVALTAVTTEFVQTQCLRGRGNYYVVLFFVLAAVFTVSNLGFHWIMAVTMPILGTLYPALLALTVGNIIYKISNVNIGAWLFYPVFVAVVVMQIVK